MIEPHALPDRTKPAGHGPNEVEAILSIMRRQSTKGWLFVLVCLAIGLLGRKVDDGIVSIAAHFFMFFSVFGTLAYVKTKHDRTLIERVAASLGLEREVLGMEFISRLESPMFPRNQAPQADNLCSAFIDGHKVSVADVHTTYDGESVWPAFRGIVLQIGLKELLPAALLLEESLTRRGRFGGAALHDTGPLVQVRSVHLKSRTYGLWLPPDASTDQLPTQTMLNVLHHFERRFHTDSWIYSVAARGYTLNLAVSFKPGLFPGWGILPSRAGIAAGIKTSHYNLSSLLALAKALITQLKAADGD